MTSFDSNKIYIHYDKLLAIKNKEKMYPITFTIDPTNRCNHNCDFCLNGAQRNEFNTELKLNKIKDILDLAKELNIKGIKIAGGGEPLLYSDIKGLINLLKKYNFDYGLTTNASLLTPEIIDISKDLFKYISISLESFNKDIALKIRKKDNIDIIKENIKYFTKINSVTNLNLNLLIHKDSYNDLYNTVNIAKELGINTVFIKPLAFNNEYKFNYDIDYTILENELELVNNLKTKDFKIIISKTRTNSKLDAIHPYKKCEAIYLGGVWGADGKYHLCCDRRNDKLYLFDFNKEPVNRYIYYWRNKEHIKLVNSINPSRDCPRCTYNSYNKILNTLNTNLLENLI